VLQLLCRSWNSAQLKILSFLLEYRQSHREAIDNVQIWLRRIRKEREKVSTEV
jgi:hypothetical protein